VFDDHRFKDFHKNRNYIHSLLQSGRAAASFTFPKNCV
jgi:hypothetical protein